jgi:hypothetical protein
MVMTTAIQTDIPGVDGRRATAPFSGNVSAVGHGRSQRLNQTRNNQQAVENVIRQILSAHHRFLHPFSYGVLPSSR